MNAVPKREVAAREPLLEPGRNCWRVEHADRVRFLIDASSYFAAVRKAMIQARHSIEILAWDVDSRTKLVPAGAADGWPEPLAPFLEALVKRHKSLRVNVLSWDFAMLFALEREWTPIFRHDLRTRRRLCFRLDGAHPIAASHHQKVVVIDDRVAFVGGLDLTRCRWDTQRHGIDEPLRCDADGERYAPFHDVQVMLDGAAARALGELARERWRRATGATPPAPPRGTSARDPWPDGFAPDLEDVDVGVARTEPEFDGRAEVDEVRTLLLDAIASARRTLFLEQQYFTSLAIGDALAKRLARPDAPEVVAVLCRKQYGWLEQRSMGVLRARLDKKLRAADRVGRYRAYAPRIRRDETEPLNVHSKVLIVDDELLTVGSANLSNRSMGFDTECNIAIEARGDPRIARAIAALRERLLGEHLDVDPSQVAAETARRHSLIASIEVLRGKERTLVEFEPTVEPEVDRLVPDGAVLDPERPMKPDRLVERLLPPGVQPSIRRRVAIASVAAIAVLLLVAAWHWTGLREAIDVHRALSAIRAWQRADGAWLGVAALFALAVLVPLPLTLLTMLAAWVLGPWRGAVLAFAAAFAASLAGYGVGRLLGREGIRRFGGRRLNRLAQRLASGGTSHVMLLRVLPATTFNVTNWIAGASRVRLRAFASGTALGLLPVIAVTVLLFDRARAALLEPDAAHLTVLGVLCALVAGVGLFVAQRIVRPTAAALVENHPEEIAA